MPFRLSTPVLILLVSATMVGSALVGIALGRYLRERGEGIREPLGVEQAALIGFVALILAFGLTMAVGRYDARRAAVVVPDTPLVNERASMVPPPAAVGPTTPTP